MGSMKPIDIGVTWNVALHAPRNSEGVQRRVADPAAARSRTALYNARPARGWRVSLKQGAYD